MSKYNTTIRNSWDIDGLSAELQALARERTRNSDLPDQYFIYSCNTTVDVYTYGESAVDVPDTINDVATKPMLRQGAIAYLGPGVMGIFMVISLRKTQQPDINFVFDTIHQATIDYVLQEHGIQLHHDADDPGLYDETNAKIGSYDFEFSGSNIIFYVTLNFLVDMAKLRNVYICGIENRSMANILKAGTSIPDEVLSAHGLKLTESICNNLYDTTSQ